MGTPPAQSSHFRPIFVVVALLFAAMLALAFGLSEPVDSFQAKARSAHTQLEKPAITVDARSRPARERLAPSPSEVDRRPPALPNDEGRFVPRDRLHTKMGAPRVDPNKRKVRGKTQVNSGLLDVLKKGGAHGATSNALGPGGLGSGVGGAMGGLRGSQTGDAAGFGGLGTRGAGRALSVGALRRGDRVERSSSAIEPNRWTKTIDDRRSTFAVDVDTASYSMARRTILGGRLPRPEQVRVEEMLNYFRYDYEPPTEPGALFSIEAEGGRSPIDGTKHVLRVGIQARVVTPTERSPANIVFLVDTSCSMQGPDRLPLAQRAMAIAVEQFGPNDRVAIATYAGSTALVLGPTPGHLHERIRRSIFSLRNGGGTAMESGMLIAYQQAMAMKRPGTLTRVIVLSDGDANIGATTHAGILSTIGGYVKEGVTLSTIGFGQGNYQDHTMERLANEGNGNYFYIDSERMAERVFGRDLTNMLQDVAQDVKIQVEFDPDSVQSYRLVGYENRDVADHDFRRDEVDAGEIGAGHQVTALYELVLRPRAKFVGTVRVRAKRPGGRVAKEVGLEVPVRLVDRPFAVAPDDFRFAVAVMGAAELLRRSSHAESWRHDRVLSIARDTVADDPDRRELVALIERARRLSERFARASSRRP